MVKCPKCDEEYSLGMKIYHECKEFSIIHGAICSENCIDYSWNCNSLKTNNHNEFKVIDYLKNDEKYVDSFKGYLSSFIFFF
ncbi:MAG: hypothetical protein ACFE9Z_08000 [Promethearchaeota archaeon]